jgi:AraC-like DNA-binding protein
MNALKLDAKLLNEDSAAADPSKQMINSRSAAEMLDYIKALCQAICNSVNEAKSNLSGRLNERIKKYLEKNSADNGLSLTSIADYFGMTPQYISGYFKKQNGVNLTDYIAEIRMQEAKRLLADPGQTILQIAQQVGYATDIGFSRVFKKIEGITPGKYRESLLQAADMKNE